MSALTGKLYTTVTLVAPPLPAAPTVVTTAEMVRSDGSRRFDT